MLAIGRNHGASVVPMSTSMLLARCARAHYTPRAKPSSLLFSAYCWISVMGESKACQHPASRKRGHHWSSRMQSHILCSSCSWDMFS